MITIRVTRNSPRGSALRGQRYAGHPAANTPERQHGAHDPRYRYAVRVPLYAAYGSNMDPAQMMQRAPHSPMAGTGWLVGWRLTFGAEDLTWEGALATIVEDPESQVFTVLYDVLPEDEVNMDSW